MNQPSDPELIDRIARGDREALAALYRRYWKAARAAAYGVTANLTSAEDAAAEGLESALMNLHELKRPESVGPWLRTIVMRAARRHRVRHTCWGEMHTLDLSWMETRPLKLHEVETLLRDLCRKTVPTTRLRFSAYDEPRYRAGLRLYLGDCPTPAATAGVLGAWPGMPEGTAAAHVRIYLEVWASILSGNAVEFRALPAVDLGSSAE